MLSQTENIIFELLFNTQKDEFTFDLTNVVDYQEDYPDLIESIVMDVNKGGISIINDCIILDKESLYWNIKINRS